MLLVVGLQEIFGLVELGDERVDIVRRHLSHSRPPLGLEAAAKLDTELRQQSRHGVFALPVTHALDDAADSHFQSRIDDTESGLRPMVPRPASLASDLATGAETDLGSKALATSRSLAPSSPWIETAQRREGPRSGGGRRSRHRRLSLPRAEQPTIRSEEIAAPRGGYTSAAVTRPAHGRRSRAPRPTQAIPDCGLLQEGPSHRPRSPFRTDRSQRSRFRAESDGALR